MSEPLSIAPKTSGLLLLDFQGFVLKNFLPEATAAVVVGKAANLLAAARATGVFVMHAAVTFRPGYPEISPKNKLFSQLKDSGLVAPDGEGSAIDAALAPIGMEPVVTKHRVGAFTGTDLERLLRAQEIETLILAGVTTSGVVLSTVRQAFDLDYNVVVAGDACADSEREVHAVLLDKAISPYATVASSEDIVKTFW